MTCAACSRHCRSRAFQAARTARPFWRKANGEEIGLRSTPLPHLDVQAAVFQVEFVSELVYDQDMGMDQANAPSKRRGIELSAQYRPLPWIEFNTDIAATKARFHTGDPASYGLNGLYITDAPDVIASFGILADRGPWFGGLQLRLLGSYPLNPDNQVRGAGYNEVNLDVGYRITPGHAPAARHLQLVQRKGGCVRL